MGKQLYKKKKEKKREKERERERDGVAMESVLYKICKPK